VVERLTRVTKTVGRKVSIIIPTLNEAATIQTSLAALQHYRQAGHELIVSDGGSTDETCLLSQSWADKVISSSSGRASQMNAGATHSSGDILLFLHADTQLPGQALEPIIKQNLPGWGRFDVKLSGCHPLFRLIETMMNLRSRISGIATGDQAIFIDQELFHHIGGFPEIPLMEDISLSRQLKKHSKPLCLRQRVTTSSRRWEQHGISRTILLMWRLRLAYFLGADPVKLAQHYRNQR